MTEKDDAPPIPILSAVPSEDKRRRIEVTPSEKTVIDSTIIAFAKERKIFQRAGFLVEPKLDPSRKMKNLARPTDELRMVEITAPRLRTLSTEHCFFYKRDKNGPVNVSPPDFLAKGVLSESEWPGIPVVESVSENPTFRADGTIHDTPGFDESSGNYFAPDDVEFPKVPEFPTIEEAREAYETLMDPFVDFPFVSGSSKSTAAAAVLTLLARPAISGPCPPFVIKTPTPRTGKDLLTDVITTIGSGRPTPGRSLPTNDEELKKVLLSLGLSGCRTASFGNCEGAIGSAALSHAVTRETLADRLLGDNTDKAVPLRLVWLFNGNNPRYKSDFGPRVIECLMDAGVADPQSRTGFKYDPLMPYVRRERPRLVAAGLTILRAFHVAGRPRHGKSRRGSFEAWDDLVRGALIWVGAPDPVGAASAKADDDVDLERLRSLLVAWRTAFGQKPLILADAVDSVRPQGLGSPPVALSDKNKRTLNAVFSTLTKLGDRYGAPDLGYFFRHNRGRPVDVRDDPSTQLLPTDVLRLEIENPRSGDAKVASWWVLDGTTPRGETPAPAPPTPPTAASAAADLPPPIVTAAGRSLFDDL